MAIPQIPDAELKKIMVARPHVVLLGAGASRAAFPLGERNGLKLPLMSDFVEILGLGPTLDRFGLDYAGRNFEDIYSGLYERNDCTEAREEIEIHIRKYFAGMTLPDAPTLYDHLVLSLREKDVIATFNWDPFLFQACARNYKFAKPPRIIFLHGNVAIGYCATDEIKGPTGRNCSMCGRQFTPSQLLYPIKQKSYASDRFISREWEGLRGALKAAYVFTIFGYSAPKSDAEAIELLKEGWGRREQRSLEQVEIIDIRSEAELVNAWDPFIHTHHYEIADSFHTSRAGCHPRRSCDSVWRQMMEIEFFDDNPIPTFLPFDDQLSWYQQLVDAEHEVDSSTPNV
jgi:hypothetical protein